jgi:S1-C subfamily serine protease
MRIHRVAAALVLVGALCGPAVAGPETPPPDAAKAMATALDIESELVTALAKVRRSSVSVLQLRKMGEPLPGQTERSLVLVGVGSGVLVQEKGLWVLTNVHVVEGAAELKVVTLDGVKHDMEVVDTIAKYDIALLGFKGGPPKGLKGVTIVKGECPIDEGNWVLATGNPFFLANDGRSVATLGVVSGLDRILGGQYHYDRAIQHDAEVNPRAGPPKVRDRPTPARRSRSRSGRSPSSSPRWSTRRPTRSPGTSASCARRAPTTTATRRARS